jgi:hypothetical protein
MIKYFKELLWVLKDMQEELALIESHLAEVSKCIRDESKIGNQAYVATKNWNP